eukprot:TRINITY_DN1694_c0_g1_i1.p2 TRINITY_DN1694_c0_g1~~TRINITY_DN1694_c0_g1_i1.p2  ORF type:complete len:450 (+),score=153.82 TRINITY_DN1694_c0_g1_i1:73-1350(+)
MADERSLNWVDIQENAFKRWCNNHLLEAGLHIESFKTDLCSGLTLIGLINAISHPEQITKYNKHPRIPIQKYENNNIALDFLKDRGVKLVNIGGGDITDGNIRLILGLIWTLILRYEINKGDGDYGKAKNDLLEWVRSKIPEYDIKGFKKDWNDGRALCALNNALSEGACPNHRELDPNDKRENADKGLRLGQDNFGIRPILNAEEMNHPRVDEKSVVAYIAQYRNAKKTETHPADRCTAYGPGLVEAVAGKDAPFTVETPGDGKLEVKVVGPINNAEPTVTKGANGVYSCSYQPTEPGQYEVHVTFDGKHVPGSIFKVTVIPEISLGGEGKILVFYSTTSSSEKGRKDVFDLQRLLEAKKIHERDNFEPWVPVDIMTREDREAVFEKAGTRTLPIVYIDDKYTGDYDAVYALNESGKLDALVKC